MASDATEAPERVGRYEILLPIAKGGMATVYLARAEGHGGFDRYVALKLTLPHLREDPDFAAHLVDEAKLVAHIRHTHVVPVLDVGEDALGVFLVMEYVAGDSLSGLIRLASKTDTPLPARVALRILVDALDGLHAAHEHRDEDGGPLDVVHRDFSPQNILVGTDGVARLADFGIAKAASRASTTAAGTIKGKMRYLSPEQARGAPLDRRCDLWAAGVVAWEILCGRRLNTGKSDAQAILATFDEVPRVRSIVPDAPQAIDDSDREALAARPGGPAGDRRRRRSGSRGSRARRGDARRISRGRRSRGAPGGTEARRAKGAARSGASVSARVVARPRSGRASGSAAGAADDRNVGRGRAHRADGGGRPHGDERASRGGLRPIARGAARRSRRAPGRSDCSTFRARRRPPSRSPTW